MARQSWAFLVDSVEFTRATRDGETSLGGSESACVGLARALAGRGHDIHVFTTKITPDAVGRDAAGVQWHTMADFQPMNSFIEWDVVCALRVFTAFAEPIRARLRLLWNQDLLVPGSMQAGVMACAWAYDRVVYVSAYHQQQWEALQPELKGIGWASRNGIDLRDLPKGVVRDPNRIIHISRPERGLGPLLAMWPAVRAAHPQATLAICRYSSMYDATGWGQVCASFDDLVKDVNARVGGITYLGELNKRQLYEAISGAAVMWYPGVATFAETNCIAATEANACQTPFVGSLKGALPETAKPSFDAGLLIAGDAEQDAAYKTASVSAVVGLLQACRDQTFAYRALQAAQKRHAVAYDDTVLAAEWEAQVEAWFLARSQAHQGGILRQLLHEDDHVAARIVATDRGDQAARDFCDYVIAGKDHTDEDYARAAIKDVRKEAEFSQRFAAVRDKLADATRILDVACGNGSFAISAALARQDVTVVGLDYAQGNIDIATAAAVEAGVSDRVTFQRCTVYDFDRQQIHAEWEAFASGVAERGEPFDGLFVGEFIEHTANHQAVIDGLEAVLSEGAPVVYTCPHGACAEMVPRSMPLRRGHVHRFHWDDIKAVWGQKDACTADYLDSGITQRGNPIGNWLITYRVKAGRVAGPRDLATRIRRTRPMPRLSVGLIAKDAALDLGRCLTSIWGVADEVVVGDTGSTDRTAEIAREFGARVLTLPTVEDIREGFAGARNAVLQACTGDWFCWIDADEQLLTGHALRKYLDGPVFNGYVLRQNHVQLDAPQHHDVPVRVFRRLPSIQFYGCVHEQPQMGDANGDIVPALDPADTQIVHLGYLTESIRRDKMTHRNRPLIIRDQQVFPERLLGKVILLRETVLQASQMATEAGGVTMTAAAGFEFGLTLFRNHFQDPAHKFHAIARPWYETALKALNLGWEVELGLAGRKGGLGQARAKSERVWVADGDEFTRILQHRARETAMKMRPPVYHTDPFSVAEVAAV